MSLDIEKAFDKVSLEALPTILRGNSAKLRKNIHPNTFYTDFIPGKRVSNNLINRILEGLQGEQMQVLWQGQLSRPSQRIRGIKQGCPLSPYIFNLIMESVLESVEEELHFLRLNQDGRLTLPIILAYADDLLIIAETVEQVEQILSKLKTFLCRANA